MHRTLSWRAALASLSVLLLGAFARPALADAPVFINSFPLPHYTFDQPQHTDMVALPGGRLLFCSASAKTAGVYDSSGTAIATWTTSTDVNAYPTSIGIGPDSLVVVFDRNLAELEYFALDGTPVGTTTLSTSAGWVAMSVAPDGDIYLCSWMGEVGHYGASGGGFTGSWFVDAAGILGYWATLDIAVLRDGTVAVTSWMSTNSRVDMYGSSTTYIETPGYIYNLSPTGSSGFLVLTEDVGGTQDDYVSRMRLDGSLEWSVYVGNTTLNSSTENGSVAADSMGHFYVLHQELEYQGIFDVWHYQDVGAFMNSPIIPTGFNGAWTISGAHCKGGAGWIDPPLATGYDYAMTGGTVCTAIDAFPTTVSGPFTVSVDNVTLGTFTAGQSVTFADYAAQLGGALVSGPGYSGVTSFRVSGLQPGVDPASPTAFPLRLRFSQETVSLSMTALYGATGIGAPSDGSAPGIFAHVADGVVRFVLGAAAGSHETIDIVDVRGGAVAQVTANGASATWRGETANGRHASPGVYFARRGDGSRTRFVFATR